jgi:hypothetical protein
MYRYLKNRRYRIINFLLMSGISTAFLRLLGFYSVYFTLMKHFNVEFSIYEGMLIGFGFGLLSSVGF